MLRCRASLCLHRAPQRRLPAPVLRLPRIFLSVRPPHFSYSSSSSSPIPLPRLPDPPRGAHRHQASQPILPQTKAEQHGLELIAKRQEASGPQPETGGIPGGTGPIFIVILLLVVLSLNYHRAEATLERSNADHDVQTSRLKIQLQQMRDLQEKQASFTAEWLEEEAPSVAAELRVSEDAARKALAAAAQRVHARIDRRAAIAVPGTAVISAEADSSAAKKS